MATLTIVVGVGASGKTTLAKKLAAERGAHRNSDVTVASNKDDRKRAGYGWLPKMVARLIGMQEDCVIDESHLTKPQFRRYLEAVTQLLSLRGERLGEG